MELFVATFTPFDDRGALDVAGVRRHVRWLAAGGVDGFAPTGTNGEFLYLSADERRAVHAATLEAAGGLPVIPCVWDPRPETMAALARHAAGAGARAVFAPPPLYHPVPEEALLRWYAGLRAAVSIPVFAYHHPRTHNPLTPALVERLLGPVGLDGMKDSSGEPDRVRALSARHPGRIFAGGDALLGKMDTLGHVGGHISGFANLYPALAAAVFRGGGDYEELLRRAAMIRSAGRTAAMKHKLGYGSRPPLDIFDPVATKRLPAPREVTA